MFAEGSCIKAASFTKSFIHIVSGLHSVPFCFLLEQTTFNCNFLIQADLFKELNFRKSAFECEASPHQFDQ